MKPLISGEKKDISVFIPYRRASSGEYEFFLQMRDEHAPIHPNMYSLFGGGIEEGESPEEAFKRETLEELQYEPVRSHYFARFENAYRIFYVFIEEVGTGFESNVTVCEGKYGSFLTPAEIEKSDSITPIAATVVEDINRYLHAGIR